jgi:hypothetical protein
MAITATMEATIAVLGTMAMDTVTATVMDTMVRIITAAITATTVTAATMVVVESVSQSVSDLTQAPIPGSAVVPTKGPGNRRFSPPLQAFYLIQGPLARFCSLNEGKVAFATTHIEI